MKFTPGLDTEENRELVTKLARKAANDAAFLGETGQGTTDDPDLIFVVIACQQIGDSFALGTGIGHPSNVKLAPNAAKTILRLAIEGLDP